MSGQPVGIQIASGVDLVSIDRIRRTIKRWGDRFLNRCYTDRERELSRLNARFLAGRFAAKEAAAKALGTGMRGMTWLDIEVGSNESGSPVLKLYRGAEKEALRQGWFSMSVSISHDGDSVVALVTALKAAGNGA